MSLPPLLLQRLAQRGLVLSNNAPSPNFNTLEEIIAENYDEDQLNTNSITLPSKRKLGSSFWTDRMKERIGITESHQGYKFCPNKYNIWHKCTLYCVNRWTTGHISPSDTYLRRYKRLIRKYPLENGWKAMFDAGCGCYYFYDSAIHKVSWLPPSHPKARVSNSTAIFRKQLANSNDEYSFDSNDIVGPKEKNALSCENDEMVDSSIIISTTKKSKVRDLERTLMRRRRNYK